MSESESRFHVGEELESWLRYRCRRCGGVSQGPQPPRPCPYCEATDYNQLSCGADFTDRGDEHRMIWCKLDAGHLGSHEGDGASWTDAEHFDA